uniref:ATP synthase F0 subunit 8 n=1 Tax=Daphnia mitsukuri TaxID=1969737 RepID=A0A8E6TTM4_9CRUS|nr:ATP synthase F0 subunit 8 [Daphnia mitsukuri]
MPQIWPMNWVILFWVFILTFTVFLIFIYFMSFSPKSSLEKPELALSSYLDWKW